ncbi:Kelch repeat and BTB domain-containing protein 6, partial [Eschrichtius robustus]|nr:Kelch repeat and BTB domain-containing protein 6 [Eschrichtius robustus]
MLLRLLLLPTCKAATVPQPVPQLVPQPMPQSPEGPGVPRGAKGNLGTVLPASISTMQSREEASRSRRLASPRGGKRPKRVHKPTVSAFFTGPEELKDTAHSAALLAQLKSFYDARLLCDVTIEVVTPGSGPGTGRLFPCNRNWLEAAPKERGPSAAEVFKCVRWTHFTDEDRNYLEGLLTNTMVKKYCLDLVEGARQMRYGDTLCKSLVPKPESSSGGGSSGSGSGGVVSSVVSGAGGGGGGCSSSSVVSVAENPPQRLGVYAKKMVIFFGHPRDPFLCCDPYSGDIYKVPSPLTCLAHTRTVTTLAVCVSPDHDIYLAAQPRKDLWVYKPAQNSWQQLADRLLCREGMDVAYLNGYIYILGGRDPITGIKLKEVECYSVQRNQWALVAPLPHSFISFDLMVIQNYLYALNSKRMFCFDPSHNMWLKCVSLKRNDFQEACVFNDEIYCICDIPVMKVYNPVRGEWRQINNIPLVSETNNYRIINHGQKLLLITSRTPQWKKNRVTVYEYDIRGDQWINIGTTLGLFQFDSNFFCLSARVYPSCLEPGQSFLTEEEEVPSESSTEWDLGGFSELDSESGSSSSLSDDDLWVQVAPQ